jgi:acetyl-CoA carboxylase carboxyl transferase subunit alpha
VADRLLMFEHSVYTVASPEACASILWRDAGKAPVAAEALRITAADLLQLGIIDAVLNEPAGGNHWAPLQAAETLKQALLSHLGELQALPERELLDRRYAKFRRMGRFLEAESPQSLTTP